MSRMSGTVHFTGKVELAVLTRPLTLPSPCGAGPVARNSLPPFDPVEVVF
jgi:hypothetical protein